MICGEEVAEVVGDEGEGENENDKIYSWSLTSNVIWCDLNVIDCLNLRAVTVNHLLHVVLDFPS